jgi:DNA-binding NtrC family response regulator
MDPQPVIWIIDSEHWPRALIRAELMERGYDAIGFENIKDAVTSLPLKPRPQLVIVELRGQVLYGADLEPFVSLKIPMMTIHSTDSNPNTIASYRWAAVLRRPLSIGQICDAVRDCLV